MKKKNEILNEEPIIEESLEEIKEEPIKKKKQLKIVNKIKELRLSKTQVMDLKEKAKRTLRKNIILSTIMFMGIGCLLVVIAFMLFIIISAPDFNTDLLYDKEATVLYDINGNEFARIGVENRDLVDYSDLPQVLVDAIVATEDSRFFQHDGFDIARFIKAAAGQLLGNSSAGGASTLTMQIVKNTFTSTDVSIIRKFTDIYMSIFKVERKYTKQEIIEFYVNQPWLGEGSWGVEQACQTYFGKSVNDLSLTEAALIAGMFQAPASYDPFVYPEYAEARRNTVLNLMVKHGYITKEQMEIADAIPVESLLVEQRDNQSKYQDYIDTVVEQVIATTNNDPYNIPMEIYTTMDPKVQDVIIELETGESYNFVNDVVQVGIAVTSVKDGSIIAVGAGRNRVGERQFNRATMISRHPGSTAKPIFAYGPYIEFGNGSTYSPFLDEKTTYSNGTSLKNADNSYMGLISMRTALVKSRNIPAVLAFQQSNKEQIAEFAHNLGIHYGDDLVESCAIGGFEGVSPLELSAAYAAFGRGGNYIKPYSFTKIHFLENDETKEYNYKEEKAMSDSTAYLITNMLVTAGEQGVGGNIHVSGTDVAAKTGTSTISEEGRKQHNLPGNASMDNWVMVYSPDVAISLWYGYDHLSGEYYTTSTTAAGIRKKIMATIANKIIPKGGRFAKPSSVVASKVELETFPPQLPSEYTPSDLIATEYFKRGAEPSEVSNRFSKLTKPTNGNGSINGNTITISWESIPTPDAVSNDYLSKHFTDNYRDYAEKYYNERIQYNNSYIGSVGYQIYYVDQSGNLNDLGFTTNTSYTYPIVNNQNEYKFVVKASYSIFKANMSDGLEISVSSNGSTPPSNPQGPGNNPGNCNSVLQIDDVYLQATNNDDIYPINPTIIDSTTGQNITNKVNITSKTIQVWQDSSKWVKVDNVNRKTTNIKKYQVKYDISYNGCTYSSSNYIYICLDINNCH